MKKLILIAGLSLFVPSAWPAYAQQSDNTIDQLINRIQQGKLSDNKENQQRVSEFRQKRDQQEQMLADAETTKVNIENRSPELEAVFDKNELIIDELKKELNIEREALEGVLFVTKQLAGTTKTRFENSLTNIQYPDRILFLEELIKKLSYKIQLPSMHEIERLLNELLIELKTSGEIIKFNTEVINKQGVFEKTEVVRVGQFNIIAEGKYLAYEPTTGRVRVSQKQPIYKYTKTTKNFFDSKIKDAKINFGILLENNINTLSELTATNSSTNELFFKCDYSNQNKNTIDTITVNTNTMKGTWTTNDLDMMSIMSFNMETTILDSTIAMTPDLMLITTPNFITRYGNYTYAINRETLTYSDSIVPLGKCNIIEKNNKF